MHGAKGFPKVYEEGVFQNQAYIVQEKLGITISDLLRKH
jgi:hypothetical protein